jgi:hypothetical protein
VGCIGLLLGVSLVIESAAKAMGHFGINNHVLYNAYFVIDFGVIAWLLYRTFPDAPNLHRMITAAIILLVPILVWDLWSNGTLHLLATKALIIGGFLLGLLTVHSLFILVRESSIALHHQPLFWMLLSIMVYYLSFIPIFGLYNYLVANNSTVAFEMSNINNVLFLLRYGLVLVGLVLLVRQVPAPHGGQ